MKTKNANAGNARRSLRNATNGTKADSPKTVKPSDQAKTPAKAKSKLAKGSPKPPPEKATSPASKRKREEEEAEDPPGDPVSEETEEVNKPSSNADPDETTAETTTEAPAKPKPKRVRKKKEKKQTEEPAWRPLELDEDKASDESKKKAAATRGGDRRKQSLVERDIPSAVMVRSAPRSSSQKEDDSDCEVLDGANSGSRAKNNRRHSGPMDVDVDDGQSEAGSNFCEIIEEGSSSLDFKKLHALARRVHLPSTLWACHVDPMSHFVSFTRFNPDFSDSESSLVDRAVVFKGSMRPIVVCNQESTSLPEEINSFETLTDVAHALQHLNATVLP